MSEKRRKNDHLEFPGIPFDPIDNEYPNNKQLIFPGNYQNTFGTFGMFGVNILNDPNTGKQESPDKSDSYLYL